jgi:hypothetical protein
MVRSKRYGNEMDVRLVVVITTFLYCIDVMPLLPVGLVVKSVDDNVGPMAMSMSSNEGVPDCFHVTINNEIDDDDDDDDVQVQLLASTMDSTSQGGSDDGGDNFFVEDDDNALFEDSDDEGEDTKEEEREEESNDDVEDGEEDGDDDDNDDEDSAVEDDSEENDEDNDIFAEIEKDFIVFEELKKERFGKEPPKAQMNSCKFLHPDRECFVECYHIVTVHPAAQTNIVKDLHRTVHGGLLRPALKPFIEAISDRDKALHYYSSLQLKHSNDFLIIPNGQKARKLEPFCSLDFNLALSKVNEDVVGQHWNSQCTWGFLSLNLRQMTPSDVVNSPSIKKENVGDGILPQFVALSELLLEVDSSN